MKVELIVKSYMLSLFATMRTSVKKATSNHMILEIRFF